MIVNCTCIGLSSTDKSDVPWHPGLVDICEVILVVGRKYTSRHQIADPYTGRSKEYELPMSTGLCTRGRKNKALVLPLLLAMVCTLLEEQCML
jgi:hypothetical protein